MFKNRNVLVTGCGSLGRELVAQLLEKGAKVTCLDNSEHAFSKLDSCCRRVLGDVTNCDDVEDVCNSAEYVIHTIAKKYIDYVEDNPQIAIRTNIDGTMNVIRACLKSRTVKKMLNVSTDKVCHAISTYGLTKAVTERLMLWADRTSVASAIVFSTIRHPNFLPSDGSCFSIWARQKKEGKPITITDARMTRWFIPITEAATLTLQALKLAEGGEIFIPATAKRYKITDLAKEYGNKFVSIGRRQGERLHEQLMTADETQKAKKCGKLWRLVP